MISEMLFIKRFNYVGFVYFVEIKTPFNLKIFWEKNIR